MFIIHKKEIRWVLNPYYGPHNGPHNSHLEPKFIEEDNTQVFTFSSENEFSKFIQENSADLSSFECYNADRLHVSVKTTVAYA